MLCVKPLDFMCMLGMILMECKELYMLPFFQVIHQVKKLVCVYDSMHMFQHTPAEGNVRYVKVLCINVVHVFLCVCVCVCVCVCMHTHMHACMCMCVDI